MRSRGALQSWVRFRNGPTCERGRNIKQTLSTLPAFLRNLEMRSLWSVIAAAVVACTTFASAQEQTVSRVASGAPNTDIRVGVYVNVRPDCTSGPLPSIQLTSPPENGKVTVKEARVTATNYKQCLALEVPAFVAFYRSRADFAGVDVLTLGVKFPDGKTRVQRISVTVESGAPGRST